MKRTTFHRFWALLAAVLVMLSAGPSALAAVPPAIPAQVQALSPQAGLAITPAEHNFGSRQAPETIPISQFFDVKNNSGSSLTMDPVRIITANVNPPQDDPNYRLVGSDNCAGKNLPPGGTCRLIVGFVPKWGGTKEARLVVTGASPDAPAVMAFARLTGFGILPAEVTRAGAKNAGQAGDPLSTSVGELNFDKPLFDLGGPLPLRLTLSYASWLRTGKVGGYNDPFGGDWSHNHHFALTQGPTGTVVIQYGPGDLIRFERAGTTWQVAGEEVVYRLQEDAGYFYLLDPILERMYALEKLAGLGLAALVRVEDRNGNALTFTNDEWGRIQRIEDGLGRSLDLTYSAVVRPWIDSQLVQVTDQAGRSVQFGYESFLGGNLTSVTDVLGQTTTFAYTGPLTDSVLVAQTLPRGNTPFQQTYAPDPSGWGWRAISQTDAYGHATSLAFNDTVSVTTITDPLGQAQQHTHQAERLLTDQRDEANQSTSFAYDAQGRRTARTNRLGDTTQVTYHPETGKMTSYTDAAGHTTTYSFTAQDQAFANPFSPTLGVTFTFYNLVRITDPDGSHQDFVYDARGNVTTRTDRAGQTWQYQYNARGQVTQATNPTGGVESYGYNPDGTRASQTGSGLGLTTHTYDAYKRLATITRPDGSTLHLTYALDDQLLAVADELGRTTTAVYDANGNLFQEVDPLGQTTTHAYDLLDREIGRTDPLGHTSAYAYGGRGEQVSFTDRNGFTRAYGYDERGWLTGVTNPAGLTWATAYDDEGAIAAQTTPLGSTTAYQVNKLGATTAITDPLGTVNHLAYDVLGRQVSANDRLGRTTAYAYDGEGRLASIMASGQGATTFDRNGLGLLTRVTDPRGKAWGFGYSSMGQRTAHTDPLGNQWYYVYDNRGRARQITFPDGGTATLTYDAASQVTQVAYAGGPTLGFAYDAAGRLLTTNDLALTYDARGDIVNSQDGAASFAATYDPGRRLQTVGYDGQATVTYTYDSRDLLTRVHDSRAGAWLVLTYDADDRLTGIGRSNGVSTTLAYDAAGRVTRIHDTSAAGTLGDQQYTLNAEGEPVQVVRSLPLDPAPTFSPLSLSFDDASQISSPGYVYDARGRQTAAPGRTFAWDNASRLTAIQDLASTVQLTYNGLGDVRTRVAGGTTTTYYHHYSLELDSIVAEKEGTVYRRFYVYTPDGALLYSIDAATNQVRFYHFDRLGSTLFLTDEAGAVSDAYAYDPYGNPLAQQGSSDQPFTYVGQFGIGREPVGSLYTMRARYYDPATARFLSRDPIWSSLVESESSNPYQYAAQNPLRYIDPQGTDSKPRVPSRDKWDVLKWKILEQFGKKLRNEQEDSSGDTSIVGWVVDNWGVKALKGTVLLVLDVEIFSKLDTNGEQEVVVGTPVGTYKGPAFRFTEWLDQAIAAAKAKELEWEKQRQEGGRRLFGD